MAKKFECNPLKFYNMEEWRSSEEIPEINLYTQEDLSDSQIIVWYECFHEWHVLLTTENPGVGRWFRSLCSWEGRTSKAHLRNLSKFWEDPCPRLKTDVEHASAKGASSTLPCRWCLGSRVPEANEARSKMELNLKGKEVPKGYHLHDGECLRRTLYLCKECMDRLRNLRRLRHLVTVFEGLGFESKIVDSETIGFTSEEAEFLASSYRKR